MLGCGREELPRERALGVQRPGGVWTRNGAHEELNKAGVFGEEEGRGEVLPGRRAGPGQQGLMALGRVSAFTSKQWEPSVHVHRSLIHNCPKWETGKRSTSG